MVGGSAFDPSNWLCQGFLSEVPEYLRDPDLYKTNQPGLAPGPPGEFQGLGVNSIWCRRSADSPPALELMLMDSLAGSWVYRRPDGFYPRSALSSQTGIRELKRSWEWETQHSPEA